MDYGRNNLEQNQKKLQNRSIRAKKKLALTVIKTILVSGLLILAGISVVVALYIHEQVSKIPDISEIDIAPSGFSTKILDASGKEIESLAASGANREYVSLSEIPKNLQHAFIAIEDSRFYMHNGIDIRGIMRAAFVGLVGGGDFSQGASTITQQLLKNNYFTNWTNESRTDRINRKIQEQYMAVRLEKIVSKEDILENYLNTINLGQNTLGVEAASERYFNKRVSDLTLSECAVIAGITQNPSRYNPISNPDENAKRRAKVLKNMLDQGFIKKKAYKRALSDEVYDRIAVVNNESKSGFTSYFVDALTDQLLQDLIVQKGYSETQAYQKLYSGGLIVHSTQKTRLQKIVDEEVNNEANYNLPPQYSFSYRLTITAKDGSFRNYSEQTMLSHYLETNPSYTLNYGSIEEAAAAIEQYKSEIMKKGDTISEAGASVVYTLQPQAAMTVIDQKTGAVVAIAGGRGDKAASKTLNRATGITRQPGSTFKIIAAFAPALDAGGMTLASVQDDAPMTYANGVELNNFDNSFGGFTTIREAIIHSVNIVTVKTLTEIGTGLGYEYAQDLGISTLVSGDNNQALALGGLTNGVINTELTDAYATIANGGIYHRPIFYTTVEDRDRSILLDNTRDEGTRVLKETTAWLLTDAMKDVIQKGTGTQAAFEGMAMAGKTGTTTKDRDIVFAGYTPYYTAAVWGGYDDNAPLPSTIYAKVLWKAVMSRIHEGKEYRDFTKPDGIVKAEVCQKSGKKPVEMVCENDPRGSMVIEEYFAKGSEPKGNCDHHTPVTICEKSHKPVSEYCPKEFRHTGIYITGGDPQSADGEYMLENADEICDIHTEPSGGLFREDNGDWEDTPGSYTRGRHISQYNYDDKVEDEDNTEERRESQSDTDTESEHSSFSSNGRIESYDGEEEFARPRVEYYDGEEED